jgi:hypothetical protein
MDWLILIWTVFVLAVYVGGYFFPSAIGIYTWNLSAAYAVFLIVGVVAFALRFRTDATVPQSPPRRKK